MAEKRTVQTQEIKGFSVQDLILVAVLLAAGAVLKLFLPPIAGMKPNTVIVAYCLAILLIRAGFIESAIIGLLAGVICQFMPGTPWLNLISELLGAVTMFFMSRLRMSIGKFDIKPFVATFVSTVVSGSTYVVCLFTLAGMDYSGMSAYVVIVLGTATIGSIMAQLLYLPLKAMLRPGRQKA